VATTNATTRRWRRPLLVGTGVAAALAVAAALEVGVSVDWLRRVPGVVLHALAGSLASSSPAEPPTDPAGRVAHYTDRAKTGDVAAQIALGVIYAKGEGVAQDYAMAANWFRRAAEKGAVRAQYDLGVLYERGRGVPSDRAQAVAWYRKAAEQGHPLAQYNLGVSFTKGEGVRRDPLEAAVWYHRAAAQGVVAAMVNLAILYERGEGVDASTVDAYAWYRAAARRGSAPAARRADELLHDFSPWDQTRAEARMTDIAASIHDPVGERSRSAVSSAPVTSAAPGPILKSGIENGRNSPGGAAEAENP
jgi:TPR repeat protein